MYSYRNVLKMIKEHNIGTAQNFDQTARRQFPQRNSTKRVSVLFRLCLYVVLGNRLVHHHLDETVSRQ